MFCYRDMTFCSAKCSNKDCSRNWRLLDKSDYNEWSESFGEDGGPVAFSDFSPNCTDYQPIGDG